MQKTIPITGASTGIGFYVAHELKKRGYRAIASCRSMEDVARLQQEGLECVQLDLASSESIRRGFEEVIANREAAGAPLRRLPYLSCRFYEAHLTRRSAR